MSFSDQGANISCGELTLQIRVDGGLAVSNKEGPTLQQFSTREPVASAQRIGCGVTL